VKLRWVNTVLEPDENFANGDLWESVRSLERPGRLDPCACCSPVISILNNAMNVTDEELCDVSYWKYKSEMPPEPCDRKRLFVNAKIFTVDEGFSVVSALAIEDGKIVATGDGSILKEEHQDAELIDCQGRTILPGFVEPHMHFLPIATIGKFEDVGPFRYPSFDDALTRLRELAEAADADQWIMARQFDPSLQEGPGQLTRQMLDTVSTTAPVFVYNASLHFAYCNSRALAVAGIDKHTPDQPGSSFGREQDGTPNGVLQGGRVMSLVVRHNPAQQDYDLAEACIEVCHRANRVGITTFCDQGTGLSRGVKELEMYQALAESRRMTTRLRYSLSYALADQWDQQSVQYGDGDEFVRATGWKIVSDGSNQGLSGLQREPYLFSEECGVAYVEADSLKEMVLDRATKGWPMVVHANGDQAIDNVLDAFEVAFDQGLMTNTPWRIEHCSILHDEQIVRMRKMNLSPSFLIGHVYYWGKAMRDTIFGEVKASLLDRTAACEENGIRWTLHSDEPVTEMGPLRCIENAVTRKLWREPESTLASHECIDVKTAIRAMTIDAAWQCHSDHEIGSLEVGKCADFVVLGKDPVKVAADEISQIQVLETWMNGQCVFSSSDDG